MFLFSMNTNLRDLAVSNFRNKHNKLLKSRYEWLIRVRRNCKYTVDVYIHSSSIATLCIILPKETFHDIYTTRKLNSCCYIDREFTASFWCETNWQNEIVAYVYTRYDARSNSLKLFRRGFRLTDFFVFTSISRILLLSPPTCARNAFLIENFFALDWTGSSFVYTEISRGNFLIFGHIFHVFALAHYRETRYKKAAFACRPNCRGFLNCWTTRAGLGLCAGIGD